MKNLALLGGKPLIAYAIEAAKAAGVFQRIVVNSEDPRLAVIAKRHEVEFYRRPPRHATASAKSDDVVYDFLRRHPCEILAWVNPIAPLQTGEELAAIAAHFRAHRLDSLITVKEERVHCVYRGRPVNFTRAGVFARTQDLAPVLAFVYSVMMWRASVFLREFERKGFALLSGKVGYYPVGRPSSVIIKHPEDLALAEALLGVRNRLANGKIRYDRLAAVIKGGPVT